MASWGRERGLRLLAARGDEGGEGGAAGGAPQRRASVLELVETIYAAALDERRWWLALQHLAAALAARRALLVQRDGERWLVLAASDLVPVAREPLARLELLARTEGHVELPLGEETPQLNLLLDRAPLTAGEAELLRLVGTHLVRAWRVTETLAEAEHRLRLTSEALDRLATGVALLDSAGMVLAANASAERLLTGESEIRIEGGRLVAGRPQLERRLAAALARLGAPHGERSRPAEVLRLPIGSAEPCLELLLLPVLGSDYRTGSAAVVFVYDPRGGASAPAALLEELYGLTPAESRLVGRILLGRTLEEAARDLGIRHETARTHLKRIFQKVGTTRQADLVRLLLTGPARVRWE